MDSYVVYCKEALSLNLPLLTIPVAHASNFSTKPLKWIRYITAAVLGSEGNLIRYNEREKIDDVTLDLEDENPSQRKLIFVPGTPIKFIDDWGLEHLKSSQITTESRAGFRDDIIARDERSIITDFSPIFCEASHLIPHSKGTEYVQALCRWRSVAEEPEIENINDVRNGILVDADVHKMLGLGMLGVLPSPNFALSAKDVLPKSTQASPPFRFTPHYFLPDDAPESDKTRIDMYRQDFRYPTSTVEGWPEDWPPIFIWEFIYGVVTAKKYGNKEALDVRNSTAKSEYYPEGIQTATDRARADVQHRKQEGDERARKQWDAKAERARQRGGTEDQRDFSDATDTVFCLWMHSRFGPDGQKARLEELAEHARREQKRQDLTAIKVDTWRNKVEGSTG